MSGLSQIDGQRQIQDSSVGVSKMLSDFLGGSNWDISGSNNDATISGLSAGSANNDAVNKGQMDSAISAAVAGAMTYQGTFDASVVGTQLDDRNKGDFFIVSVAGTVDSIVFNIGDHLVVNDDITGAAYTGKIDKIDNTEAADILRSGDVVNDLTTGGTAVPLSAQQGVVLKGLVDGLQTEVDDTQAGAGLAANGDYVTPSGSNYIDASTSLASADSLLDAQAKVNADAIGVNAGNISSNDGEILALQNALAERVFGEEPTITDGSGVVGALANIPVDAGTARVYLNGMRMVAGAGRDYTINESTGVITFLFNLKDPKDTVAVDYEY